MQFLKDRVAKDLAAIRIQHLYRDVSARSNALVSFASNDYLGLSQHPKLIEAGLSEIKSQGVGGRSSSVVEGYSDAHAKLEARIAEVSGRDDAIFFPNAFTANQAVFDALIHREDRLYVHRDNHASLNQALRAKQFKFTRFNDELNLRTAENAWIICDHIFSVTGKRARVAELMKLDAMCFFDDIHGVGVYGEQGLSLVETYEQHQLPLISWGFGKALGCYGGALLGEQSLIDLIRQSSRAYIYSTAVPAYMPKIAHAAIDVVLHEPEHRMQLKSNVRFMKDKSQEYGLKLEQFEDSPIFCMWFDNVQSAVSYQHALRDSGYAISLMRWPTVPRGKACIRLVIRSNHSMAMLDGLLLQLKVIRNKIDGY